MNTVSPLALLDELTHEAETRDARRALLRRLETERFTPLPEPRNTDNDVELLLNRAIHLIARALSGQDAA